MNYSCLSENDDNPSQSHNIWGLQPPFQTIQQSQIHNATLQTYVFNRFTDGESKVQAKEMNHSTITVLLWSLFPPWSHSHESGNNSTDFSGFLSFVHCCHHLKKWIAAALRLCDYGPVSSCATQNKSKDLNKMGFPCPSVCKGDAIASLWMVILPGKDGSVTIWQSSQIWGLMAGVSLLWCWGSMLHSSERTWGRAHRLWPSPKCAISPLA